MGDSESREMNVCVVCCLFKLQTPNVKLQTPNSHFLIFHPESMSVVPPSHHSKSKAVLRNDKESKIGKKKGS